MSLWSCTPFLVLSKPSNRHFVEPCKPFQFPIPRSDPFPRWLGTLLPASDGEHQITESTGVIVHELTRESTR